MNAPRGLLFAAALGLVACQQKADDQPAATAAPAPPPLPAPAPSPTGAPVATAAATTTAAPGTELPTPEDFEQQALDEINPQNLEQELDKLEKEIGQ